MNQESQTHPAQPPQALPASYGATDSSRDDSDDDSYEIQPSHCPVPASLDYEYSDDDDEHPSYLSERLLAKASKFDLPHDVHRGFRGTQLRLLSFARPHMRAFHGSWIAYFVNCFVAFAMAPLLPEIQTSLDLTKSDVWLTNIWSVVGGIPMGFLLGPLCDKHGSRIIVTALLVGCAIPTLLAGLVTNLKMLLLVRTVIGSMDTFVPGQYWITCHFTRQVVGTAMAISGGWGASGSGVTQLVVGTVIFPLCVHWTGSNDLAWRVALIFPALLALLTAWFFYFHSDDCPLGNFSQVKKAGLMMERSAVDSFRSGALNLNSWLLFLQYVAEIMNGTNVVLLLILFHCVFVRFAGSCGVDFTMCNGTAIYFNERFDQPIAAAGAIAFAYGISSIYARGLGGYVSDAMGDKWSLQGRLAAQMMCMTIQGLLGVVFARTDTLGPSIIAMIIFSILVQVSECCGDIMTFL